MIVTKTVYLIAKASLQYNEKTYEFEDFVEYIAWPYDSYGEQGKCVAQMEVQFDAGPELNPIQLRLEELEKEKTKLQADFQSRITEIQRQINECLAIEG